MGFLDRYTNSEQKTESRRREKVEAVADGELTFDPTIIEHYGIRRYSKGENGTKVDDWSDLTDPITKAEFVEYADAEGLPIGEYKLLAFDGNSRIRGKIWSVEAGTEEVREEPDTVEELKREIMSLREEIREGGDGDWKSDLMQGMMNGDLNNMDEESINRADQAADVMAKLEGESGNKSIFGEITDKTDAREVLSAIGLSIVDNPDKIRDISRNTVQGLREGVMDDGPHAPPGVGTEQEPAAAADQDESEPAEQRRGRTPKTRERFEELVENDQQTSDDIEPEPETESESDDAVSEVVVPANATELDELGHGEKAELASEHGFDGNPWSTSDDMLREFLVEELFEPLPDSTVNTDTSGSVGPGGAESEPVTHSEVQAGPGVADAVDGERVGSDGVVTDGGGSDE